MESEEWRVESEERRVERVRLSDTIFNNIAEGDTTTPHSTLHTPHSTLPAASRGYREMGSEPIMKQFGSRLVLRR